MLVLPKKYRSRSSRPRTLGFLLVFISTMTHAQNYTAKAGTADGLDVVRLVDAGHHTEVSVIPSIGNTAYEMKVNGKAVLWSPFASLAEWKAKPTFIGVPFLSPWANRLDQDAFWANGRKYRLNPDLNNYRRDQFQHPIHGLISYAASWRVVSTGADKNSAWITSRLDFGAVPEWLAQFPFPHAIEMTYRLKDGVLEVHTLYENRANQPMPLAIGYHPYFTLSGVPRDEWRVHLPVREHVTLSDQLIPTGERTPNPHPDPLRLRGKQLDDVFTNIVRDASDQAEFFVEGGGKKISVVYGPKYTVAVVYAPPGREFVCFEPMTGITNAFNLAHEGKYPELQSVPANGKWAESFWIKPSGY